MMWPFRRARHKQLTESVAQPMGDLREFIYLDEVSVNSLLASRVGAIPQQITDTASADFQTGGSAKLGASLPGFNADGTLQASQTRSRGSETQRKAIIQATFKQLMDLEKDRVILRKPGVAGVSPMTEQQLVHQLDQLAKDGLLLPADSIARGRLVELEVELDVEPVYRMNSVVSGFLSILSNNPEAFGSLISSQFEQARAVEMMLRSLLGGLVPIRAALPDYLVHSIGGNDTIAHRDLLSTNDRAAAHSVCLVGVAEESLFWKDLRRVLFSGGRYRVLARVATQGVQKTWKPIKLAHLLEVFAPNLEAQMNEMSSLALRGAARKPTPPLPGPDELGPSLQRFHAEVQRQYATALPPDSAEAATNVLLRNAREPYTLEAWRAACEDVVSALFPDAMRRPSQDELVRLRQSARKLAAEKSTPAPDEPADLQLTKTERFLDCELIAIYW